MKLTVYVICDDQKYDTFYWCHFKRWAHLSLLHTHFFTKESLAYEEMNHIPYRSPTMVVRKINLRFD